MRRRVGHSRALTAMGVSLLVLASVGASGCSPGGSSDSGVTWPRCFSLVEGDNLVALRLEPRESLDDEQAGQITVYSYLNGQEEFPPETTIGRLTPTSFVYADGTTLTMDGQSLTWPQDSLLEGAVFSTAPCP